VKFGGKPLSLTPEYRRAKGLTSGNDTQNRLTDEQRAKIRRRVRRFEDKGKLALEFGVSRNAINRLMNEAS
jgi:hypothetical protein